MQAVGSKCMVFNQNIVLHLRDFSGLACLKYVHYCIKESILVQVKWLSGEYLNLTPPLIFSDKPATYIYIYKHTQMATAIRPVLKPKVDSISLFEEMAEVGKFLDLLD